jgi:hypothetical protein
LPEASRMMTGFIPAVEILDINSFGNMIGNNRVIAAIDMQQP